MKTDTKQTFEEKVIKEKLNRMIAETGEHPFIFRSGGRPVFVSFPVEANDYFTPDELKIAERLVIKQENPEFADVQPKLGGLSQKLHDAKQIADGLNQKAPQSFHKKDRLI